MQSYFYFPLKPRQFQNQVAGRLRVDLTLRHALPMANFKQTNAAFPLVIDSQTASEIRAHYEGSNVSFSEDFALTYELKSPSNLSVLFYRSKDDRYLKAGLPVTAFERPRQVGAETEPGYFQASALYNAAGSTTSSKRTHSDFIVLFDTSLSIRWDKLERQFEALEKVLYHLQPEDRFRLLLFNSKIASFHPDAVLAMRENIAAALDFVKKSFLLGGTSSSTAAHLRYRPASTVRHIVQATRSKPESRVTPTRAVFRLRIANLEPTETRWDDQGKSNVGRIVLPADIATGQHALEILAEDFAHNVSSRQVMIAVVGR